MKEFNKEEFNILCAQFLNWELKNGYYNPDMNHEYSFIEPSELKFHSDWNLIMEVWNKLWTNHADNLDIHKNFQNKPEVLMLKEIGLNCSDKEITVKCLYNLLK